MQVGRVREIDKYLQSALGNIHIIKSPRTQISMIVNFYHVGNIIQK